VVNGRSALRNLALAMGVLFFVGTVVQFVDQLNIIYAPPNVPDTANVVDRVLASIPYRENEWPIYLTENGLVGLGFVVLVGLGIALAARVPRGDDRRQILLWTIATAGILGAIGQLVLLGSIKASVDIPYCDCGFKDQEIVSQVWAEMVAQSAVQWLIFGASILAAAGLVVSGRVFGGRAMSRSWAWLGYASAAVLVITVVFAYADLFEDATNALTLLVSGILIPAWAIWLGLRFPDAAEVRSTAR
jgi:hypothetical protein